MEQRGIFCLSFPEKQKSTGFSNRNGRSSMSLLNHAYLKSL